MSFSGSSPNSTGTGPAHLAKCQLIGTKLKQHENVVGQPLNQLVCNGANSSGKGQLIWKM